MAKTMTPYQLTVAAMTAMLGFRRSASDSTEDITPELINPFIEQALPTVERGERLDFMLLAFPFKSGNKEKVFGNYPDLAEVLSLKWLNHVAGEVSKVYEPGVRIIVGSDGLALNDILHQRDVIVHDYVAEIGDIMQAHQLDNLTYWGLHNQFPNITNAAEIRKQIPIVPGRDVDSLHAKVLDDPILMYYVNGVSRFVQEDFKVQFKGTYSNREIERMSRQTAYKIVERGDGLRQLYAEQFPNAIRLSVHPQPVGSDKIGIRMSDTTQDRWLTPWHSMIAETAPDKFGMFKLNQVKDNITRVIEDAVGRPMYARVF